MISTEKGMTYPLLNVTVRAEIPSRLKKGGRNPIEIHSQKIHVQ